MQFNSFLFILAFLPLFLLLYFLSRRISVICGQLMIIAAGLVFYSFAGMPSFLVLLVSMAVNYICALLLQKAQKGVKVLLFAVIAANAGLLLFYKYVGFMTAAGPSDTVLPDAVQRIAMPLGISFFTFQQIMYVVSVYSGRIKSVNVPDYAAYILYFPKLIMGPLAEPDAIIAQMKDPDRGRPDADNVAAGLKLFSFGLFKKAVMADTFMRGVTWGFSNIEAATSADLILTMLFYTFEIYFDFSGYSDMAVGISRMINIDLPVNFDSPYKAVSIRDFWKRWHISLTRFFTEYIYFPLGGSRKGQLRTCVNIMIVFLVSGIWHGANFTFILWGALHGSLQVLERLAERYLNRLTEAVRWICTFAAVNVLWLLFRSESIAQWRLILHRIAGFQSTAVSDGMIKAFILPETPLLLRMLHLTAANEIVRGLSLLLFTMAGFFLCLVPENNYRTQERRTAVNMLLAAAAFVWGFLCLSSESVFVYFNF